MQTKRYCGHCLLEVEPGLEACPRCGRDPAATEHSATAPSASPAAAPSTNTTSEGLLAGGASDETQRETIPFPPPRGVLDPPVPGEPGRGEVADESAPDDTILDRTVGEFSTVRSPGDEVSHSWREGQLVANRFRVIRCIGQGGMGKVYLAKDEILGRLIALKRVPQEIVFDGDARDDLRQETNRLLDLAHENVIRVHTYYDEPDWPFFAMEYLEGPTLKNLLRDRKQNGGVFSLEELLAVARQVGEGLGYAHSKQLVHRDLKPANLMLAKPIAERVCDDDVVKITDFGISRVVADSTLRNTGVRSGTLPYMSPEQFCGEECTPRSDIYSLAVTYYELLGGRPPFHTGDIGYQILHLAPKTLPNVPRVVNQILQRGMAKNPRARYESVEEFTLALQKRKVFPRGGSLIYSLRRAVRPVAALLVAVVLVYSLLHLAPLGEFLSSSTAGRHRNVSPRRVLDETDLENLTTSLERQLASIPTIIDSSTVTFQIRDEGPLNKTRFLFHNLYFTLDADSESGARVIDGRTKKGPTGKPLEGLLEFEVDGLEDGPHVLEAAFKPFTRDHVDVPLEIDAVKRFEVDTTGPEFIVEPVDDHALYAVGEEEGRFVTYHDSCQLRLDDAVRGEVGDIEKAEFRAVSNGIPGEAMEIPNPRLWEIDHLKKGQNHFHVAARDFLGNEHTVEFRIYRLNLSDDVFGLDRDEGVRGNQAYVRGRLDVETYPGLELFPELHFYVNGEPQTDLASSYRAPRPRDLSFETRLTLTQYSNTIELYYSLGRERFRFPNPVRIEDVVIPAPKIKLLQFPERTMDGTLVVEGVVEPYFDGLHLKLEHRGISTFLLRLVPEADSDSARFRQEVWLSANDTNELEVESYYDGKTLRPPVPIVHKVYCDMIEPELVDGIEFVLGSGLFLHVQLYPSEALAQIRIRQQGEKNWNVPTKKDDGTYLFVTPMPAKTTTFEVELKDLVGHVALQTEKFDSFLVPDGDARDVAKPVPGVGRGEGALRKTSGATGAETRIEQCAFLQDHELAFKKYSESGEEMAATEVSENLWNSYLFEKQLRDSSEGEIDLPMTIGSDFDPGLLQGFVEWVETECDDGYEYFIPSPDEWRMAFSGVDDPTRAPSKIGKWFEGELDGGKFNPPHISRYSRNRVSPILSRPENRTVTGLFDMEGNVQEIVVEDRGERQVWKVIGGYNSLRDFELKEKCIDVRLLSDSVESSYLRKFTGLRLARRPKDFGSSSR